MSAMIVAIALMLVVSAPGPVSAQGGKFTAADLAKCGVVDEWESTPFTDVVVGAVRIFARDRQKGRSQTVCFTGQYTPGTRFEDPFVENRLTFSKALRKNAESVRFIVSPGCNVEMRRNGMKRQLLDRGGVEIRRGNREIPPRADNKWNYAKFEVRCGDNFDD